MMRFLIFNLLGKNYSSFVEQYRKTSQLLSDIEIIKKYTFHDTWYCTKINLLLASDSEDLKMEAEYIKNLQLSIQKRAKNMPVCNKTCFRGMHQSEKEYKAYELNEIMFIPSFLSTSKNKEKFYMASNHNSLIEIKLNNPPNNAINVDSELSIYSDEEEEVLFSCYSKFKVIKKEENYTFRGKNFEFHLILEHINQPIWSPDVGTIIMMNFLGY